jgi:hypothetical protein
MTFHHTPAHAATQAQSKIFARRGSIQSAPVLETPEDCNYGDHYRDHIVNFG